MHKTVGILLVALMVALFVSFSASPVNAEEPSQTEEVSAGTMLFDLVFVRPVGIIATGLGAATYVVTIPFSGPGGNLNEALEKMVKEPFRYTFTRPIGKI
jgi:uncharacterized membrane protein YczE